MFYIIVFASILIPLLAKNKATALKVSCSLLFILWGLQYDSTCDWPGMLEGWNDITNYIKGNANRGTREYEPLYVYLVRLFDFLGFYGWLIICAVFDLTIIYWLIKKFVHKEYYWLAIFIFVLRIDLCLLFINSNRQTLSLMFVLLSNIIMLTNTERKNSYISYLKYFISLTLIFAATQIHTAAILGYISIPVFLFCKYYKSINKLFTISLFIVCNILFWGRYFINLDSDIFITLMESYEMDGFSGYMESLNLKQSRSIPETILYCTIMNLGILMYKRMSVHMRFFATLSIIGIIMMGYMFENLKRATQYYYVYLIILIPYIIEQIKELNYFKSYSLIKITYSIVILFCIYSFIGGIKKNIIYHKWDNFQTIFSSTQLL